MTNNIQANGLSPLLAQKRLGEIAYFRELMVLQVMN